MKIQNSNLNLKVKSHVEEEKRLTKTYTDIKAIGKGKNDQKSGLNTLTKGVQMAYQEEVSLTGGILVENRKIPKSQEMDIGKSKDIYDPQPSDPLTFVLKIIDELIAMAVRRYHLRLIGNIYLKDIEFASKASRNWVNSIGNFKIRFQEDMTTYEEVQKETLIFLSKGKVKTVDGRDIDLNLNFYQRNQKSQKLITKTTSMEIEQYVDPLVINLDQPYAGFSEFTIDFDLTQDGQKERFNFPRAGSGFLAIDKNDDGKINDGSELFGTKSGDGFNDLANYDEDNNGWIDENDKIFSSLRVWTKNPDGSDKLVALVDANVGAIYLDSAQGDFTVRNSSYDKLGKVRKTGIYLKEDGSTGTVQHLDVAVGR